MNMDLPPPGRPLLTKLDLVGIKVNRQTTHMEGSGNTLYGHQLTDRQFSLFLGKALTFSRIQPLKWAEESFFYNAQQIQVDILSSLPGLAYCQLCSLVSLCIFFERKKKPLDDPMSNVRSATVDGIR